MTLIGKYKQTNLLLKIKERPYACSLGFTVTSWGVWFPRVPHVPHVLTALPEPAVILTEKNMNTDKGRDPRAPPERQKRPRREAGNHTIISASTMDKLL